MRKKSVWRIKPKRVSTQRFVCPQCGGKMTFEPSGELCCQNCGHRHQLPPLPEEGQTVREHHFVSTMSSGRGHARPVGTQTFVCQGCGASFFLAVKVLSLNCSYCGSAHVIKLPQARQLIPPEGVIPFRLSAQEARQSLERWLKRKKLQAGISSVRGLYLPAWTFDLVGHVGQKDQSRLVYEDDILVPASNRLSADLWDQLDDFDTQGVVPYDRAYLADWPAEVYEITVSDASLAARHRAIKRASRGFALPPKGAGLFVASYKLIVLPVWIANYHCQEETYRAVVNGQTGQVGAQTPPTWLQRLLQRLLGKS